MKDVMFKIKYEIPSKRKTSYIDYVATRSGVVYNDVSHNDLGIDDEIYIKYIDERPGSHGLFDAAGAADLEYYSKLFSDHNRIYYKSYVSLRREDAVAHGYQTQEDFRKLADKTVRIISKELEIPLKNIVWCAAFHDEGHHPHIHLTFFDKNPKISLTAMIPKDSITEVRTQLQEYVFANERAAERVDIKKAQIIAQRKAEKMSFLDPNFLLSVDLLKKINQAPPVKHDLTFDVESRILYNLAKNLSDIPDHLIRDKIDLMIKNNFENKIGYKKYPNPHYTSINDVCSSLKFIGCSDDEIKNILLTRSLDDPAQALTEPARLSFVDQFIIENPSDIIKLYNQTKKYIENKTFSVISRSEYSKVLCYKNPQKDYYNEKEIESLIKKGIINEDLSLTDIGSKLKDAYIKNELGLTKAEKQLLTLDSFSINELKSPIKESIAAKSSDLISNGFLRQENDRLVVTTKGKAAYHFDDHQFKYFLNRLDFLESKGLIKTDGEKIREGGELKNYKKLLGDYAAGKIELRDDAFASQQLINNPNFDKDVFEYYFKQSIDRALQKEIDVEKLARGSIVHKTIDAYLRVCAVADAPADAAALRSIFSSSKLSFDFTKYVELRQNQLKRNALLSKNEVSYSDAKTLTNYFSLPETKISNKIGISKRIYYLASVLGSFKKDQLRKENERRKDTENEKKNQNIKDLLRSDLSHFFD